MLPVVISYRSQIFNSVCRLLRPTVCQFEIIVHLLKSTVCQTHFCLLTSNLTFLMKWLIAPKKFRMQTCSFGPHWIFSIMSFALCQLLREKVALFYSRQCFLFFFKKFFAIILQTLTFSSFIEWTGFIVNFFLKNHNCQNLHNWPCNRKQILQKLASLKPPVGYFPSKPYLTAFYSREACDKNILSCFPCVVFLKSRNCKNLKKYRFFAIFRINSL